MVQYRFIELAKQGNSKSIATLLNGTLHPQGINAKVSAVNGWLHILLESEELPERSYIVDIVRHQLIELAPESIKRVKLLIKRYRDDYAIWGQEFDLTLNSSSSLTWPNFDDNQQYRFDSKPKINTIKNRSWNHLKISKITLGIVVVILFMAVVVFISKMLVKRSPQTINSFTTYPQLLLSEEYLI
ncbi:MAG: hypothetical protein F6K25_04290 [Okeania sp. SIO2G4]|uniref:hypothetical protein n=1 Tax=unclassified Okeania TaxID=2634635 RepID=UPI0013BBFB7C|nr:MULTISPECIES: hypothetical protein [unclassified Okeania]NEP04779.1 hypothetical protein [Okeania sp. SIO4D6]NEP70942.1 hypothetical protein [Okeania sp. SIO2G5]NEP92278.1 hypothetical protein [Okeania sp. SIO2F5]NEQ89994.1 hypothetical protein [Okeania sp. SIO2G4]